MSNLTTLSRAELAERRRQLRWKRRLRALQAFWRLMLAIALTGGAIWLVTLPGWVIRQSSQVNIVGNELLSVEAVRALLPLEYPQSLWEIEPDAVARSLQAGGPIAQATVKRQLFPPSLTIEIRERRPVAIAYAPVSSLQAPSGQPSQTTTAAIGLLDTTGAIIPIDNYTKLTPSVELPKLKVIGDRNQYRSRWPQLYQAILQSPVTITEIDWRDPGNLILLTELGVVHIGPFDDRFPKQMVALNQLRKLPDNIDRNAIAYINLKDPASPLIQLRQARNLATDEAAMQNADPSQDDWSDDP